MYRLGVILCDDSPLWKGTLLWNQWSQRFKAHQDIQLSPIDGVHGSLPKEEDLKLYDGFVLTGSLYSVNDDIDWIKNLMDFVQWIATRDTHKVFGVCFGHQLVAKSFGCEVGKNKIGKVVNKTERVYTSDALLKTEYYANVFGKRRSFQIMESHGESVHSLSEDFQVLAHSDSCEYEMILWTEKIISTQGHPEYNIDVMKNVIVPVLKENNAMTEDEMDQGIKTLDEADIDNTVMFVKSFFMNNFEKPELPMTKSLL